MIRIFNEHFNNNIGHKEIIREYSGLRLILFRKGKTSNNQFSHASREAEVDVVGILVTIYGGKWISTPSLSRKV